MCAGAKKRDQRARERETETGRRGEVDIRWKEREGGRERLGIHTEEGREGGRDFFFSAILSFAVRMPSMPSMPSKDGSKTAGELLFACGLGCRTPRLPRGLASGRKCSARNPSTPRPPWPSIAGSLGFSARRVCVRASPMAGWLKGIDREGFFLPFLFSSHPLF